MGTFLLLVLTWLLCFIFYAFGFVYMLIRSLKHGGLKRYFYDIAFSLDQTGNVICGPMFNDFWIHPDGHKMGCPDETISYVLGTNLRMGTLFPFGKKIAAAVDYAAYLFVGEVNHCLNAADKGQNNSTLNGK